MNARAGDSSALVAIALDEPEREAFVAAINEADTIAETAPTLVEAGIVLSARIDEDAGKLVDELVAASDAGVIEFRPAQLARGRVGPVAIREVPASCEPRPRGPPRLCRGPGGR